MSKKFEIGEELEIKLYALEHKLRNETTLSVFNKEEQAILFDAYYQINKSVPSKNCTGCFAGLKKSLVNWLTMYPKEVVKKESILKFNYESNKTESVSSLKEVKPKRKPRKSKNKK